jgi:hypothetical protein
MKRNIPFFSVLAEAQTYLNIVYIFFAFPLSILYFSLVIAGISLSIGLVFIVIGFFVFLAVLMMLRGFRWLDVELTRVFLGKTIHAGIMQEKHQGFTPFLKRYFGSSLSWKLLVYYLFVKFPLDTVIWSFTITFIAITFNLLLSPVLQQYIWYDDEITHWLIDFFGDVYVLPFMGIIWGMISLHVIRGLAWVSGELNVIFLQDSKK